MSNAPEYVVTGSAAWTPVVGNNLRGLLYSDFRFQSEFNTGSDLFVEKEQNGVMVVNARAGIGAVILGEVLFDGRLTLADAIAAAASLPT